ncbi:MAG: methionine adenosyltransferase [Bacteroidaceae bacterium]|nr:methionine adenosyltransferase [Bacteroidaceae bacterium]
MAYLFTSESVSEGHPDKVADQISDSVLDTYLAFDSTSKVACETLVTTNKVVLSGEVTSSAQIDQEAVVRSTIKRIGYTEPEYNFDDKSCQIFNFLHAQSADILRGVARQEEMEQGAGDQGMMFGYATDETEDYMPLPLYLSHMIVKELAAIRHEGKLMTYLRPDAKSQVTVAYSENGQPLAIDTIVVSTQHDEFIPGDDAAMQQAIRADVLQIVVPRVIAKIESKKVKDLFCGGIKYYVNPTGKFVIGGPDGDTGLTGRKIIVDTYGGRGAHGGGAFSGKDPSKVDRSAAYAARHIAKNLVAAGVSNQVLVQVSYAIGVAEPVSVNVNTFGNNKTGMTDSLLSDLVKKIFDLRPKAIEKRLKLNSPIYSETASYGHVGRKPQTVEKTFTDKNGISKSVTVELFTWEKLDYVEKIKEALKL